MTRTLAVPAQAKINLVLEVLKRREAYHNILSIAQTISLHDMLTFEEHDDIAFTCNQPSLLEDNLVTRAAFLLRGRQSIQAGARIHRDTRIPWGAGLGGGSSDAATTLIALNELWGCGLSIRDLTKMGAQLGADVPLFLLGGTVLLEGRGDTITPLPQMTETHLVLLVPPSVGTPNKTGALYGKLDEARFTSGQFVRAARFSLERRGAIPQDLMFNAFEGVAVDFFPGLREEHRTFSELAGRPVHLAGSGPCLYALCADTDETLALEERLRSAGHDARLAHTTGQLGDE